MTYPRTDSRYLTDDMKDMLPSLIYGVAKKMGYEGAELRADPARPDAIFNSSKVTDHHAIIPTATMMATELRILTAEEESILHLISVRLLCAAAEVIAMQKLKWDWPAVEKCLKRKEKQYFQRVGRVYLMHFINQKKK